MRVAFLALVLLVAVAAVAAKKPKDTKTKSKKVRCYIFGNLAPIMLIADNKAGTFSRPGR